MMKKKWEFYWKQTLINYKFNINRIEDEFERRKYETK